MCRLDKQIHGREKNWLTHLQKMPSETAPRNFRIINLQEDVIEEGQEIDGWMFEDGAGQDQPSQMMMMMISLT
jgi:hypothetical protein